MTTMRHDPIDPGNFGGFERPVFPAPPARVGDRMTRPAVTITPEASIAHAWRLMEERRIRHLPVVDADAHLIGIVTESDLREALAAEGVGDPSAAPAALIVGDAMTWNPVATAPGVELATAVELMLSRKLSALPVVESNQVIGILTGHDILKTFAATHHDDVIR
jgi:acetoin utilization protein AcuB